MEDRRVRKSKKAIKQAFIQLLKEKDLEKITIQEISDLADINRGTFYLNFIDKYALLEEMEDEQVEKIWEYVDISQMDKLTNSKEEFIDNFANVVVKKVITHINENFDFYSVVLSLDRKSKIEQQISAIIGKNLNHLLGSGKTNTVIGIPADYYLSYVSGSMLSIIKHWINDPNRVSSEELVNYVVTIASNGPLSIMKKLLDEKNQRK